MNDMESVYDANSLLDAFNKSKKGTAWKESVQRYEMNLLSQSVTMCLSRSSPST